MTDALQGAILPIIVAATLGILKWAGPVLKDKVPNFIWPIAVIALAKAGTSTCTSLNVQCGGNPLGWDPGQAQVFATGVSAIVIRELSVYLRQVTPVIDRFLEARGLIKPQ